MTFNFNITSILGPTIQQLKVETIEICRTTVSISCLVADQFAFTGAIAAQKATKNFN